MKRITVYIFMSISLLSYSQEELVLPKIKQNTIGFSSYISIESDVQARLMQRSLKLRRGYKISLLSKLMS